MKIRLIASDLDGTLFTDEKKLSEATKAALDEFMEQGGIFVPATGRSYESVPKLIREYPGIEYIIASNGGAVYSTKENRRIYQCLMSASAVEAVLAIPRGENTVIEAFVDGIPYSEARYVKDPQAFGATEFGARYVKSTRRPVKDIDAFVEANKYHMDEMSFVCPVEEEREAYRRGLQKIPDIFITSSMHHLLEIGHIDSGKGKTLLRLLDFLGISPDDVMAFGDADNDCDMITSVKYGIAMGNASSGCKRAAVYVADTNEKDGIAKAILHFMKCEK